jgi:glutamate:GABA antiporter
MSSNMPSTGAGGLYLWTRNDFGPWQGFLCFWTYWMGIVFWFPNTAMFYISATFYALGPKYFHLADSRLYLVLASLATIWLALGTNLIGLRIGKWTEPRGSPKSGHRGSLQNRPTINR